MQATTATEPLTTKLGIGVFDAATDDKSHIVKLDQTLIRATSQDHQKQSWELQTRGVGRAHSRCHRVAQM
jgi:hypothetical protein